jgi:hypothetical protein
VEAGTTVDEKKNFFAVFTAASEFEYIDLGADIVDAAERVG